MARRRFGYPAKAVAESLGYADAGGVTHAIRRIESADDTGPVEIVPPDGKDVPFLTYVYANGVEVTHGGEGGAGVIFRGTEGKIWVDRGKLETEPASIMQ
ncbi:MAG TPA: hypothetical protein VMY42_21420, partial [Thermoguttaceae bacterium]|nr:hypothetical protein [Thermoguttaceae bacterium]